MSNVKGNDIDDLFKRASDKYPLRTDSADWDKLSAALDKDPSLVVPPPNAEEDRRRRKRFFWLFLLLPLGGLVYYAGQMTGHNFHGTTPSAKVVSSSKTPTQPGAASTGHASTHPAAAPVAQVSTNPGDPGATLPEQAFAHPGAGQPASAHPGTGQPASTHPGTGQQPSTRPDAVPDQQASTLPGHAPAQHTPAQHTPAGTGSDAPAHGSTSPLDKGRAAKTTDKENQVASGVVHKDTRLADPELSTLNYQRARTTGEVALNVSLNATNSPVATKENKETTKGKTDKNNKNKKSTFLYGGLLVAPDLSTVKFQSVKGTGTTFGILLGYQLNRKWAIETGAYYDHKKYYTDGEYFKKQLTNPYKLVDVTGSCNMWEIPLNIRYNLSSGEKTKWFATAGLSTYLMTKESYVYKYMYNGSTWPSDPWSSKTSSQYWFSIINLSIGYEQKIGKIGNLRLEPYLRIPLKGMGSGSLPIMSAGLNIGITRRIW